MRARHRADDVESIFNIGNPVAHGFIERVLQRPGTRLDWHHRRTQQLHPIDIGSLAFYILGTHVNHAFHPVARGYRGAGNAMLARPGLSNYAWFTHALGQQRLADGVVDFVRTSVIQVFTLQQNLCPPQKCRPSLCMVNGGGAPRVMFQLIGEFRLKIGITAIVLILAAQFLQRRDQRFSYKYPAIRAKMAALVGKVINFHYFELLA